MKGHDRLDEDYLAKMLAADDPKFAVLKRPDGSTMFCVDSKSVMVVISKLMWGVHSGHITLVPAQ